MSLEKYDPNCPGCRPAIFDLNTQAVLPDDHPVMVKIFKVYDAASLLEKRAWHAVTCKNSRAVLDMALAEDLVRRMQKEVTI